jgi:iron complex transport system substrate-binding protein
MTEGRATTRRRFITRVALGSVAALTARFARAARKGRDSAGRDVEVPDRIERVFAAGPPAAILLYTLAPDLLLGWTNAIRPYEREYFPPKYADLPALGRLTGRGNTANLETVIAARPDIILDYGAIGPTYVSLADRVQAQIAVPYALIDGRFDGIAEAYRLLGRLLDRNPRAELLARYAETLLAEVDAGVGAIPPERRPRVYYGRGPTGLQTGLAGSINVETIERAGGLNVAAALGPGGLANVSLEQVLLWDPDVIVTIDPQFYDVAWHDARWSSIRAVRDGRVYLAPNLPFGWVDFPPSVNRLIGLRWLAWILHPSVFRLDMRASARDFYREFYHQGPTDEQLDRLLANAGGRRR